MRFLAVPTASVTQVRFDAVATDPGELLRLIAAEVMTHVADLAKALTVRIVEAEPELGADAALVDSLSASVLDNVSTVLRVFEVRPDPETVRAPAAAVDFARRLAQHGVPISALLRTYRLGQAAFQQAVLTEIARADLDSATVAAAAEELSTVAFAYVDRISEAVVAAYQQEHDDWMRSRTAARSARVTALLGNTVAVDLAVREWARRDPAVAERLRRVDNGRISYLREMFASFIDDPDEVEARSTLAFALAIGQHLMATDHGTRSRRSAVRLAAQPLLAAR
jgi:hypothetical protein